MHTTHKHSHTVHTDSLFHAHTLMQKVAQEILDLGLQHKERI